MIAAPVGLLLAAIAGAVVYLLFEPVYEAAAWFKIEERTPYPGVRIEGRRAARSRFSRRKSKRSAVPLVLGPVIKRPEIARMPEIARQADKVAWLGKQIKVAAVGESECFKILLYAGPDPKAARPTWSMP